MKKLLMTIFGLTLILPLTVNAEGADISSVEEGNNSTSTTVTIGSVETPVYEVYMIWDDPTFNWVYDKSTGVYKWKPSPLCQPTDKSLSEADELGTTIYNDDICSVQSSLDNYDETTQHYEVYEREHYYFGIEDLSTNGRIVPSVKWTVDEKYNYVEEKFTYRDRVPVCKTIDKELFDEAMEYDIELYTNNSCTTSLEDRSVEYEENKYYGFLGEWVYKELDGEELPDSARFAAFGNNWYDEEADNDLTYKHYYGIALTLENKETPTTAPTAGDTLGTITITIRAAE